MCGITGIHFKNPRDKGISQKQFERLVDELLIGIEPRGRDATGILVVDANGVPELTKADTAAKTFIRWRGTLPRRVRTVLGHTRFATQGKPENLDNDHPVVYGSCYAIHNGHISNDSELFLEHSLERNAEVDSEIIPALFDKYGLDKAHMALQQLEGNMATAVVDPARFPNQLVLAKGNLSPVIYVETKYGLVFASTESALRDAFSKALGWTPKASEYRAMTWGDLLYLDGDKSEKLRFTPKSSRSSWNRSTQTGGTYYYSSNTGRQGTNNERLYDACKSCGCKRLWHGSGGNFSGPCQNRIELEVGGHWICRCDVFVEAEKPVPMEYCDGCGREFPLGDLKKVGKNYFCPTVCAMELFKGGPSEAALRRAAETVIATQIQVADELTDGDEDSAQAWEAREGTIHAETLKLASEECGLTVTFIDWLLFKAPIELFEADQSDYLNKAHTIADETYKSIEKDLRDTVLDVDIARRTAGDRSNGVVVMGPTEKACEGCGGVAIPGTDLCDECSGEVCGVVIEMFSSCVEMD